MKIIAIIAVRNGSAYMANCLLHLMNQGIDFLVIDNDSTDDTLNIVRQERFKKNLVAIEYLPYHGSFNLTEQLRKKTQVINYLNCDWVMHVDVDEIMHPYTDERLFDAIKRIDAQGYNVVNFNEFVFLPTGDEYAESHDGIPRLKHYYYFEPFSPRLMRAWKKSAHLSSLQSGGHVLTGKINLANEAFALRHYMFLNQQHALDKYTKRNFAQQEVARGWHKNRIGYQEENFIFPGVEDLCMLDVSQNRSLDKSRLHKSHYWYWSGKKT